MTSEEIIQRLLDEKKISVKEAMIILKDLSKIGFQQIFPERLIPKKLVYPENPSPSTDPHPPYDVVVMYGVLTNPYSYDDSNGSSYTSKSTINNKPKEG